MAPTAAEMMRRQVVTVDENSEMGRVEGEMKLQNVHHVCVLDGQKKLVGIVSRGDVLRAREHGTHQFVRDYMTRRLFTVRPDAPVGAGLAIMIDQDLGAVPVIDADHHLLGILVGVDFLRVALQGLGG